MASIKALAKHFGGCVLDWSIDWLNSSPSRMSHYARMERGNTNALRSSRDVQPGNAQGTATAG